MSVGFPTAGTWSSSQWRPDNEFETHSVSNQCNVDVRAALRSHRLGEPIKRNVGSEASRSASLRSSYPAKRL